jgi:hypothetical protein
MHLYQKQLREDNGHDINISQNQIKVQIDVALTE